MKKWLTSALSAALAATLACSGALAVTELHDYEGPAWTFDVTLEDLDESLLTPASPASPLEESYVPAGLVRIRARHNDENGACDNGGIYKASSSEMQLTEDCLTALTRMFNEAELSGVVLYLRQGYRAYEDQSRRYSSALEKGDTAGVPKPGETDYQTGLAVTVVGKDWRGKTLSTDITQSAEYAWLSANAARYGFIVRNPEGKDALTGSPYEPWHLRFVGRGAATYISGHGLCLEEFLDVLAQAKADFAAIGGDLEAARNAVKLPDGPVILTVTGPDGDHEISIFH